MRLIDDRVIISASDVVDSATCEFALLRKLDGLLGRAPKTETEPDEMLARTAELGAGHEQRVLSAFREKYGIWSPDRAGGVYEVTGGSGGGLGYLQKLHDETLRAIEIGADVIYQAAFFDGEFNGRADFLVRETNAAGHSQYAVYDTKLARHAKVQALIQLAAYADQLHRARIPVAPQMHLLLGDGSTASFPVADIVPVYHERRRNLLAVIKAHCRQPAVTWGDGDIAACGRCATCEAEVERHRDLLLVANMRVSQRKKLIRAGIGTIDDFAASPNPVRGVAASLWHQARMQCGTAEADGSIGGVSYSVHDANRLKMIPPTSPGDIFFDFEGDPLWTDGRTNDWGLEYLFGVVEQPDKAGDKPIFKPFWAHDRIQEKQALKDFLDYVVARRQAHPDMHIYHYAPYERTALLRLAARHNYGEDIIDDLLRGNVLVDLYAVVRKTLRISGNSYSIKKLEPLYMGEDLRDADVKDAAASVVAYANYCQEREAGNSQAAETLLHGITEYNEDDCVSTLRLRDWLLSLADQNGVQVEARGSHTIAGAESELPAGSEEEPVHDLADRLFEAAGEPSEPRTPDQQAIACVAAAIDFYKREAKPFWWEHFNRLSAPIDEWEQNRDVFVVSEPSALLGGWEKETPRKNPSRRLKLTGTWAEGSTVTVGSPVWGLYDPAPEGLKVGSDAGVGWGQGFTVEAMATDALGRDLLTLRESLPKVVGEYSDFPFAIVPGGIIQTKWQEESVRRFAELVAASLSDLPADCALDILRRQPPQLQDAEPLPVVVGGDYIAALTNAIRQLDRSYLAVQGPPGTGKTYTGSHVIAALVSDGWRVGVVGQSHAVVDNMLRGAIKAGVDPDRIGKKSKAGDERQSPWRELSANGDWADLLSDGGCLIGGTVWDFVNPNRFDSEVLDLLVVDEAGQFSLANTIAVSRATTRLMLLGDPQQLPQVSQGRHPEPVNESALGWLAEGHDTLPPEYGYFLANSWRMHPALCAPVSDYAYDGRLESQDAATHRYLDVIEPGIHPVFVNHLGNATSSDEEAVEVVRQATALLNGKWTSDAEAEPRQMTQHDVLVVAAYNAQVGAIRHALDAAGLGEIRVGTVDKFQGQEAAVVIVSMAASSADEVPRGMEFLLSRNRINVAVSRGQWAAIIVRSPALTEYLPATPHGLAELGAFIGLCGARRTVPGHARR
ncbi:TM0106 family RecB-like putative nuclease [Saxibacter everestensis]|uniref:TM0106 family RecB-like putative nuclease n=1 Tax=Saxibacter everestensis TaxID=2909229 RepID=A0ABY8QRA8_9MICO|nr:TM0106 family RecB-like putative nuclease [Brevibacteriaceae bacterium ZFBP1038]